ncbi:MAG: phenylalanine--tRNA ligase subunit beta [Culicoidibacterales bacterium]
MLVSLNWLKDYLDVETLPNAEDLAHQLSVRGGLEVEGIEEIGDFENVVIGYVESKEQHPEADRLNVCQVNVGEETVLQIVCGAPNVAAGQKVIVAKIGAVLPGNFKIKKAKLRGVESQGMICALEELGIDAKYVSDEFKDGIQVLPEDAPIGKDAMEYLHLRDTVLELSLTPDRADAMSIQGVAYEVAALYGLDPMEPVATYPGANSNQEVLTKVELLTEKCYQYLAKVVTDVTVAPAPQFIQSRLIASGIRPINNVVDITNYVMLETGQPLHAFDLAKFTAPQVIVRQANEGETIVTLDEKERTLTTEDIVVTDGEKAVALAGVMGGANSEVDAQTTTILLESAIFAPTSVRRTSNRLALRSDSSSRFEKGLDPEMMIQAIERAAQLLALYAGATPTKDIMANIQTEITNPTISVTITQINQKLGVVLTQDEIEGILDNLGFEYTVENAIFAVTAPTRRRDIKIVEDVVEEIGRIYGFDNIPAILPSLEITPVQPTLLQSLRQEAQATLAGVGLQQVVTYSLTSPKSVHTFVPENRQLAAVSLMMPMSEERSYMRQSIVPSLIETIAYNQARTQKNVAIFEVSRVYGQTQETTLVEKEHIALAATGDWQASMHDKQAVDFYTMKGMVEALLVNYGVMTAITYQRSTMKDLHPGRSADLFLDGTYLGVIGQIHPQTAKEFDVDANIYVAELDLSLLATRVPAGMERITYDQVSKFPSMTRDLAVVVGNDVLAQDIVQVARQAAGQYLTTAHVFDVYAGEHMPVGKKSVSISLTFNNKEQTLEADVVQNATEKVLAALATELNATLR